MLNKTAIVITTINPPSVAIQKFCKISPDNVFIIGDVKTNSHWNYPGAFFLGIDKQNSAFAKSLPQNHYSRKMLGYIYAKNLHYSVIYDTDDDNIPKNNWFQPPFSGKYNTTALHAGFINIYQYFTDKKIWPRGLPLSNILNNDNKYFLSEPQHFSRIGIWQGLADLDPNVDAIYRLTCNHECFFTAKTPIVLNKGTISPLNTQNTFIIKECFSLLYIPSTVTFRFCDILRGIIAQPIMWAAGYHAGFYEATVEQERNEHDYFKDFLDEIPMYQHCEKAFHIVYDTVSPHKSMTDNIISAYIALYYHGIVKKEELHRLNLWLKEIN